MLSETGAEGPASLGSDEQQGRDFPSGGLVPAGAASPWTMSPRNPAPGGAGCLSGGAKRGTGRVTGRFSPSWQGGFGPGNGPATGWSTGDDEGSVRPKRQRAPALPGTFSCPEGGVSRKLPGRIQPLVRANAGAV